ncbi:MAG: class I SAM-dependent methyltransferase [Nannocystis sp.]|nr:class I SAM-dependent methyltransferase [Nannocystis sp.]
MGILSALVGRHRNRRYWDVQARSDHRWHISHSRTEEEFERSGAATAELLFGAALAALPATGCALEIGCGAGRILGHLAPARPQLRLFGVDVSAEMIRLAQARLREHANVILLRSDGRSLDLFPDATFDLVYSALVLQHLPSAIFRRYLAEAGRVLKLGGLFRFQVQYDARRNGRDLHLPNNFRTIRYHGVEEIRELTSRDFEVVEHTDPAGQRQVHDFLWTLRRRASA